MMGEDDRHVVMKIGPGFAAISQTGRIRILHEAFVTGLVTGANCDVVLSAGHTAFYWQSVERKGWVRGALRGGGQFSFSLQPGDEDSFIELVLIESGYSDKANLGHEQHDWSIFRLQTPALERCENIRLTPSHDDCAGGLIMPAFHFDKPETLLVDKTCKVKGTLEHGIIVHDCDTKDGSSGAPLFCRRYKALTLLGINISGLTQKEYEDPGVYGLKGSDFHPKWHKNYAVTVGGDFYQALQKELENSRHRAGLNNHKKTGEGI